ncbi:MAG: hypothetical protein V3V33_10280 [Candidatus Lokiarchaeia archaeon]
MNTKERYLSNMWPRIEHFLDQYSQASYKQWYGPYIWSEDGDLKRIITHFCEDEFGILVVHNETSISKRHFSRFEEQLKINERKKMLSIDIDVTDAEEWQNDNDYRNNIHELFIEVKGMKNDLTFNDNDKKIEAFKEDCKKLKGLIDDGYCKYGISILVDQGDKEGNSYIPDKEILIRKMNELYSPVIPLIWQKK